MHAGGCPYMRGEKLHTGHLSPCVRGRNGTVHGALEFASQLQKKNKSHKFTDPGATSGSYLDDPSPS